ncbi:MAG: diguanylate cyclase [Gammaproteobacteria bacterium]|nr:diguanylate cyclase [Gammaproteobacteria bacterium]
MRLKHFVITILLIYVFVVCGGFLLYRIAVVYPQLESQTLLRHKLDLRTIDSYLNKEQRNLNVLLYDWAKWDDVYLYMNGNNAEFEVQNLSGSILGDLHLNGMYLFRNHSELAIGLENEKMGMQARELSELVAGRETVFNHLVWPNNLNIFHKYHYQPVLDQLTLFSVASIQDSNETKVAKGYLVFSRLMDLSELRRTIDADLSLLAVNENNSALLPLNQSSSISHVASQYTLGVFNNTQDATDVIVRLSHDPDSIPALLDYQTVVIILVLLVVPLLIIYVISKLVLNPLSNMSQFILSLKSGELSAGLPQSGFIREVKVFSHALTELMRHVRDERIMLEEQSLLDSVTCIKNSRAFDEEAFDFWRAAPRVNKPILITVIEADFFKRYLDVYGQEQGSEALKAMAASLKGACRRSNDQVYRLNGAKFAITMTLERAEDVEQVLQAFQRAIANRIIPFPASPISPFITVSIGACLVADCDDWMKDFTYKRAVESADKSLFKSKRAGGDQYTLHVFTSDGVDVSVKKHKLALTLDVENKHTT